MILIDLVVGVLAIFASGIMAHMYRTTQIQTDLWCSVVGFFSGLAVLINLIGKIAV